MGFLTDWLTDWLKELLIEGIMGNLTGLFDTVNSRVGEIAVQVGTTPAAWNAGVFSLIRQLSETVILPIAGLILTFVATYELIQLIIEKNNLHDLDYWIFFKWIFKTACAILILSNTFNIVMAVFDVSQSVIARAAGIVQGSTDISEAMLADLEATLETLAIGEADGGGEALAQRTGGHFDARGQAVFRMARGTGVSAATEVLQIVQGQAVAGEVQLDVLGEGGVATGKNEAIAAFPVGVVRIMLDEVLVQRVGDGRQGDGGAGVAGACLLNRVSRKDLRHLDGALVELGLLEFGHGLLSFQLVGPRIRLVPGA